MNEWLIGHCTQAGMSHIKNGEKCQDHIEYSVNGTESCLAAVLADGLGSRENSEWASRAATKAAAKWLIENSEWLCEDDNAVEVIRKELLDKVKKGVLDTAREQNLEVDTMDCNMAFLCIQRSFGKVICGQLGDCAVCILDEKPRVLTAQNGSAIGTSTVMTARPEELCVQIVELTDKTNGFILTSDGLDGEIYRKNSTYVQHAAKEYFNTLFTAERDIALQQKILDLQNTKGDKFDDDISIVVASCAKGPIDLPKDPMWLCRCRVRNSLTNSYCAACHADFLSLYPSRITNKFPSLDDAIIYLNAHPQEELELLNLSPIPAQNQRQTTAKMSKREKDKENKQKTAAATEKTQEEKEKAAQAEKEKAAQDEERLNALRPNRNGGSSAFVQQQVQQKRDEAKSDLSDKKNGSKSNRETGAGGKEPKGNKFDQFMSRWELPLLILAALIITFSLICSRFGGKQPPEIIDPTHQTGDHEQARPTEAPAPENYVGETDDGVPHGGGVLYEDGYFWVGNFVDGEMDGWFHKISAADPSRIEQIKFRMGEEVQDTETEPETETMPPETSAVQQDKYVLTESINRLYLDETLISGRIVDLRAGDEVTMMDREPVEIDGVTWVWIDSSEGEGMCEASKLIPVTGTEN